MRDWNCSGLFAPDWDGHTFSALHHGGGGGGLLRHAQGTFCTSISECLDFIWPSEFHSEHSRETSWLVLGTPRIVHPPLDLLCLHLLSRSWFVLALVFVFDSISSLINSAMFFVTYYTILVPALPYTCSCSHAEGCIHAYLAPWQPYACDILSASLERCCWQNCLLKKYRWFSAETNSIWPVSPVLPVPCFCQYSACSLTALVMCFAIICHSSLCVPISLPTYVESACVDSNDVFSIRILLLAMYKEVKGICFSGGMDIRLNVLSIRKRKKKTDTQQ